MEIGKWRITPSANPPYALGYRPSQVWEHRPWGEGSEFAAPASHEPGERHFAQRPLRPGTVKNPANRPILA